MRQSVLLLRIVSAFKNREKCALRNLHIADHFHALLSLFLFLKELALSADITTVTFGGNVLAECRDGLSADNGTPDGRLDCNFVLLAGNFAPEPFTHLPATGLAVPAENQLA